MSGRLLSLAAVAASAAITGQPGGRLAEGAGVAELVGRSANKVCTVWLAKAKKEFGSPVTPAQLYAFAQKAKALETQELAVLVKIPGRTAAGTAALQAVVVDINEIGSAITAWNQGNAAKFVTILKKYLNDGRAKSAFAVAGATQCG